MADIVYNSGLDELAAWETSTYLFLLLQGGGYTPDRDHVFVADLGPGSNEVDGAGYARVTAATKTRTVDNTGDLVAYDCDDPAFGAIAAGETVTGMVLYRFATDDTDSPLVGYYDLADTATTGAAFTVALAPTGVAYLDQAA
jgi:hypothetical protein